MFAPGCMWHVMHWLEGIALVKACWIGWPGPSLEIIGFAPFAAFPVAAIAIARIGAGVIGVPVVGVDDVASRAAAGSVVTGVVVGAQEGEERVEQAGLLQAEEDGVRAQQRPVAAVAQLHLGAAPFFLAVGDADLRAAAAPALEDAQHVARLSDLPAGQGVEEGENALQACLLRRWWGDRLHALRHAVRAVALAEV